MEEHCTGGWRGSSSERRAADGGRRAAASCGQGCAGMAAGTRCEGRGVTRCGVSRGPPGTPTVCPGGVVWASGEQRCGAASEGTSRTGHLGRSRWERKAQAERKNWAAPAPSPAGTVWVMHGKRNGPGRPPGRAGAVHPPHSAPRPSVWDVKRVGRAMEKRHARQPYAATRYCNSAERACQTPTHSQRGFMGSTPCPAGAMYGTTCKEKHRAMERGHPKRTHATQPHAAAPHRNSARTGMPGSRNLHAARGVVTFKTGGCLPRQPPHEDPGTTFQGEGATLCCRTAYKPSQKACPSALLSNIVTQRTKHA